MILDKYVDLIEKFVNGKISIDRFEYLYLEIFQLESEMLPDGIYEIINSLFLDVERWSYFVGQVCGKVKFPFLGCYAAIFHCSGASP